MLHDTCETFNFFVHASSSCFSLVEASAAKLHRKLEMPIFSCNTLLISYSCPAICCAMLLLVQKQRARLGQQPFWLLGAAQAVQLHSAHSDAPDALDHRPQETAQRPCSRPGALLCAVRNISCRVCWGELLRNQHLPLSTRPLHAGGCMPFVRRLLMLDLVQRSTDPIPPHCLH